MSFDSYDGSFGSGSFNNSRKNFYKHIRSVKKALDRKGWGTGGYLTPPSITVNNDNWNRISISRYAEGSLIFDDDDRIVSGQLDRTHARNTTIGWLSNTDTDYFTPRSQVMTVDRLRTESPRELYKTWISEDNTISFHSEQSGKSKLDSGSGNDRLYIFSHLDQSLKVKSGSGNDYFSEMEGHDLQVKTGSGNDYINWEPLINTSKCVVTDFDPSKDRIRPGYHKKTVKYSPEYNGAVFSDGLVLANIGRGEITLNTSINFDTSEDQWSHFTIDI